MPTEPLDLTQAASEAVVDMEWPYRVAELRATDAHRTACELRARITVRIVASDFHIHSKTTTGSGAGWESSRALVDTVNGL